MGAMRRAALLVSFLTIVVTMVAAEFYDLFLLSWQSHLILVDDWNLWDAAERSGTYYLPFTTFSALPYGPLFYYPTAAWLFVLDALRVLDADGWTAVDALYGSTSAPALLKLPNLAVFLGTAWLLRSIAPRPAGSSLAMLWVMNPAVIVAAFVMGQNDGWTMLLVLAAFRLAQSSRGREDDLRPAIAAMAILGLGAAVKLQPALLFLPFALALDARWERRAVLLAVAGLAFLLPIVPFVSDPFFRHHALFNPQGQTLLDHRIGHLPLFWPMYGAAALWPLTGRGPVRGLVPSLVAIHAVLFVLSDWPPERAAWFVGVSIVACAYDRAGIVAYAGATIAAFVVALRLDNGLAAGVFSSLSGQLAAQHGPGAAIDGWIGLGRLRDIVVLAAGAGWLVTLVPLARGGERLRALRVSDALLLVLALALPAYFAASIAYGGGGITMGSAGGAQREMVEGQIAQPLIVPHDGIGWIELHGTGLIRNASLEDANGRRYALRVEMRGRSGWRFHVLAGPAKGRTFVLRFSIAGGELAVEQPGGRAPATVDGEAAPYVIAARYHFERDWGALASDAAENLARRWPAALAVSVMLAPAFFALARARDGDSAAPERARPPAVPRTRA